MAAPQYDTFEEVKTRLDQIVDAVGNDDLPLEEALDLYEEAVGLGLAASRLMEEGIAEHSASAGPGAQDASIAPADSADASVSEDLSPVQA